MQGMKRRLVYVVLFEVLGILIAATTFSLLSGAGAVKSGLMSVMITTIGMAVNFVYNIGFEAWETRQRAQARTLARRILHAIGFQVVLVSFLIPLIAWWLDISLIQAFLLDAVLIAFFPVFTFIYSWCFDAVFGLPDAVRSDSAKRA